VRGGGTERRHGNLDGLAGDHDTGLAATYGAAERNARPGGTKSLQYVTTRKWFGHIARLAANVGSLTIPGSR
jgi:hypothetical protein